MKATPLIPFVGLAFLLAGCARSPLSLNKNASQLAPAVGAETEDFRYISHVVFAQVEEGVENAEEQRVGFVALSSDELILAEGSPKSVVEGSMLRIPFEELEGMVETGPYLQLKHQKDTILVLPYVWFVDTADLRQLEELTRILSDESVPSMAALNIQGFGSRLVFGNSARRYAFTRSSSDYDLPGPNGASPFYHADGTVRDSPAYHPLQEPVSSYHPPLLLRAANAAATNNSSGN